MNVPLTSQGADAAKKIVGRERGIVTGTLGIILAVMVTAANLSDNAIGIRLLDQAKQPTQRYPKPGSIPASKTLRSNTAPSLASTSSPEIEKSAAFTSPNAAGSSNEAWGGLNQQPHQTHNGRGHTNLARHLLGNKRNLLKSNALSRPRAR